MTYVAVSDAIKVYRTGDLEVTALREATFSINRGRIALILGPSGSGKTTLLNLIGGLDLPTAGSVEVDGRRVDRMNMRELAQYRRTRVGFVFQFFNLIPTMTALGNVEFPMALLRVPREERTDRAMELLRRVGLEARRDHFPHQMSGGEQQRAAVAVALANDPPLLLADEPTGELDRETGQKIIELLGELREERGKTVIVVSHDPRMEPYADDTWLIEDGRLTPHTR